MQERKGEKRTVELEDAPASRRCRRTEVDGRVGVESNFEENRDVGEVEGLRFFMREGEKT